MGKYIINGGKRLEGEIEIEGSKNAVLPILAACLLNGKTSIIHNCPKLRDVNIMINIIEELGCKVKFENNTVIVDSSSMNNYEISKNNALEMRSSIIFLGAVLTRMNQILISHPGGCVMLLIPLIIYINYRCYLTYEQFHGISLKRIHLCQQVNYLYQVNKSL